MSEHALAGCIHGRATPLSGMRTGISTIGVGGVGLGPVDCGALPVARRRHRVDHDNVPTRRDRAGYEQSAPGLDRDGDLILRAVAVLGCGQVHTALQVLTVARDQLDADRLRVINALTALVRGHDLGADARWALTGSQITTIAGPRHLGTRANNAHRAEKNVLELGQLTQ